MENLNPWDELENYEQIPKCTCGGYKCDIGSRLENRREEEIIHQFLMGLKDMGYGVIQYSSNRFAAFTQQSDTTLVQEERMKMITRTKEEKEVVVGLSVQTEYTKKGRIESKQLLCSHCGRFGLDDN